MIYFRLLGGKKIDMNNERTSDKYALSILKNTYNIEDAKANFEKAIEVFRDCEKYWTQNLHKSPHLMKEAQIFTELIVKKMDGIPLEPIRQELQKLSSVRQGIVKRIFMQVVVLMGLSLLIMERNFSFLVEEILIFILKT